MPKDVATLMKEYILELSKFNQEFDRILDELTLVNVPEINTRAGFVVDSLRDIGVSNIIKITKEFNELIDKSFSGDIIYNRDIFNDLSSISKTTKETFNLEEILGEYSAYYSLYKKEREIVENLKDINNNFASLSQKEIVILSRMYNFDFKENVPLIPIPMQNGVFPSKEKYIEYFTALANKHLGIVSSKVYRKLVKEIKEKVNGFEKNFSIDSIAVYYDSLKEISKAVNMKEINAIVDELKYVSVGSIESIITQKLQNNLNVKYLDSIQSLLNKIDNIGNPFLEDTLMINKEISRQVKDYFDKVLLSKIDSFEKILDVDEYDIDLDIFKLIANEFSVEELYTSFLGQVKNSLELLNKEYSFVDKNIIKKYVFLNVFNVMTSFVDDVYERINKKLLNETSFAPDSTLYDYLSDIERLLKIVDNRNSSYANFYSKELHKKLNELDNNLYIFLERFDSDDVNPDSPYLGLLNNLGEKYDKLKTLLPKTSSKLEKVLKSFEFLDDEKYYAFLTILGYKDENKKETSVVDYHISVGSLMNLLNDIKTAADEFSKDKGSLIRKGCEIYFNVAKNKILESINKLGIPVKLEDSEAQALWYYFEHGNSNFDLSNIDNETDKNFLYGLSLKECMNCNDDVKFGYYFGKLYNGSLNDEEFIDAFEVLLKNKDRLIDYEKWILNLFDLAEEKGTLFDVVSYAYKNDETKKYLMHLKQDKIIAIIGYLDNSSLIKELIKPIK